MMIYMYIYLYMYTNIIINYACITVLTLFPLSHLFFFGFGIVYATVQTGSISVIFAYMAGSYTLTQCFVIKTHSFWR